MGLTSNGMVSRQIGQKKTTWNCSNGSEKTLPVDDTMKYRSRINHIGWETVSFKKYSAEDCKQRWVSVQGHLRRYRLVNELVEDAVT